VLKKNPLVEIFLLFSVAVCAFGYYIGVFDRNYSKKDLIENYNLKSKEITEVRNYIKTTTPDNKAVMIEFDGNQKLVYFHVTVDDRRDWNYDLLINSPKTDSLLHKLGWTQETLSTLKSKLDNANCISVESGEPCTIGYQRSGMGMYHYKIFNQTLNDSLKKQYNDGCTYIYYKDNVVLEYGGGAIGRQCFEDEKK